MRYQKMASTRLSTEIQSNPLSQHYHRPHVFVQRHHHVRDVEQIWEAVQAAVTLI